MKIFYACVLIAFLALLSKAKADWRDDMKAMSKSCQEEVHTTDEELQKFFKNGMKPEDATDAIKCHIKCMMEKRGHIKDGVFDDQSIVESSKKIPLLKDHINEIAKAAADCKEVKGENDCETAYKILMCFKENKEALGIPRMIDLKKKEK